MQIHGLEFSAELGDILNELVAQLRLNNIPYLQKMKETSTHFQVTCPYHSNGMERRPSAGIRKSDGVFHCFACNEVHELQEVISHCFGEDDLLGTFGWNWLLKNFLTISVEERKSIKLDFEKKSNHKAQQYVSEEELKKYRWIHPYMYSRKLTDDIIDLFDIGYDADTRCITFPVRDPFGNCLFIARRSVKTKYFNYPRSVEKPLYGLYEILKVSGLSIKSPSTGKFHKIDYPNEIIICESMLDALTCWEYGKFAIALNGLGSENQFKMLNQLPCRKYILATDKDEKGKQARERFKKSVPNKIITEYDYNSYPDNAKDINDMSEEEFKNLIEIF